MAHKRSDIFVSVVIPVSDDSFDVVKLITKTATELKKNYSNYELIIIDNGYIESANAQIEEVLSEIACIRVIRLARQHDIDTALFAGVEAAIGDYLIMGMPEDDIEKHLEKMIKKLRAGADVVQGINNNLHKSSMLYSINRRFFYWYTNRVIGANLPFNSSFLIGLNRKVVNSLTKIGGQRRHIRFISGQLGFKRNLYKYTSNEPSRRKSFWRSLTQAIDSTISYSSHPLRILTVLGIVGSVLNLFYAGYALFIYLTKDNVAEGWTTTSVQNSAMFFLLFLILSIMGEYVGRILDEVRVRPPYHVMEELVSTVLVADETRRNVAMESKDD